jgi:hypothetical protein
MSGKKDQSGKQYTEADYLAAINVALASNYVSCDEFILISKDIPVDKKVIKKNAYEKLSEEAKEIIFTVIERPDDFVEFSFNNSASYIIHKSYNHRLKREPSKSLEKRLINLGIVQYYFCKKWKKNLRQVKNICQEISQFCECF